MKWGIRENQLANHLHFLASVRNRCAHDERLYCYHSHIKVINNPYHAYFKSINRNGYFSVVVAFKTLLSGKEFALFQNKLEEILTELSKKLVSIDIKVIMATMDLPRNWRKISSLK